jgi:hypothetical protein
VPLLKEQFFVKTSVRVDRLNQKLKTEGVLSQEEISIKHPFHPDIDILFWAKEYSGEPYIYGVEVKYFRLLKDAVYPNIYEGLGEAMMLLTFGVNHASLWHLFDPEIPLESVTRYRELTQNLVSDTYSHINYQSWLLPELSKLSETSPSHEKPQGVIEEFIRATQESASLSDKEKNSLLGSLKWLLDESINQAGRRLAEEKLGSRVYAKKTAPSFFSYCYDLRSRLVHGKYPLPEQGEINSAAGQLEVFVSDLLSGQLLEINLA